MAGPWDLTNQDIEKTYQRILQTPDGISFYDGTGSAVTFTATAAAGGSNTQVQFNSASLLSGSSNFTFNYAANSLTLTGSFNVSGSTTQVGTNNLFGNTAISGSLTISGSKTGGANPTINIYGGVNLDGYLRLDPVDTNINPSISASYIYVSGSTNDLYFTQNGQGYVNTTRLRWLEGNLYTGLLNGGIITATLGTNTYQISSGSGIIVNLNASYNDNPYPTIQYLNWGNLTNTIDALSGSFDQQFVAISSSAGTAVIKAQGTPYNDGDYNNFIPIGIVIHQNRSTINAIQTFPGVAYGWKQRSFDFIKAFGPLKIAGYTLAQSGSSTRGLVLSGGTAWVDGRNYIVDPNNPSYIVEATGITTSKIYRYYQSGSNYQNNWGYLTNAGAGFTDIDPTQYSNAGTLTLVGSNKWSIQRVFYFPNSATKAFYIYYGNAEYANKTDAIAALLTEPFNEAPNTAANAILVGYMLLRNNADFTTAASYEFRPAGLFRGSGAGGAGGGGGGATTLAGLTDVSLSSLTYGDLLAYNASTGLWNNTHTLSGSYTLSGSLVTNDGVSVQSLTASFISASGGITGSLFGTASYATTASYALNGGVTQLLAGSNISLSPSNGLGQVTISSTGGGGVYGNTSTGSYGSFFSTQTQTAGAINTPYSMSFNNIDISNGVTISGSASSSIKITNAGVYDLQFSAQLQKQGSGGGVANILIWIRKNNIDLSATNTYVQLPGGTNSKTVAAWNWFLNAAAGDEYRIMWATDDINAELYYDPTPISGPTVPSVIATVARVDQFLSNTGSFTGSFTGQLIGTASWATNAVSASLVRVSASSTTNANYFLTFAPLPDGDSFRLLQTDNALYYNPSTNLLTLTNISAITVTATNFTGTASYATQANSASYATQANSASYATQAATASFLLGSVATASYVTASGVFGPYGSNSVVSSSFAVSASWAPGATPTTPGGVSNNIQFNSGSAFGGSNNLRYSFNPANSDADQLTHQYNYDFSIGGANSNQPASYVPYNTTSPNNQKLGLSHFQISQGSGTSATTIYRWNAVPGGTGTDLEMYGFKCDYSLLLVDTDLGSGNNVASRIGTLKAAWSWNTGNTPAINDDFVDGDLVYNELGLVTFTLVWNDPYMELQMDTSGVTAGNTIFQGIFTNFGVK